MISMKLISTIREQSEDMRVFCSSEMKLLLIAKQGHSYTGY